VQGCKPLNLLLVAATTSILFHNMNEKFKSIPNFLSLKMSSQVIFQVLESASFMPEFYTQSNDVALMALLGTIQVWAAPFVHFNMIKS